MENMEKITPEPFNPFDPFERASEIEKIVMDGPINLHAGVQVFCEKFGAIDREHFENIK